MLRGFPASRQTRAPWHRRPSRAMAGSAGGPALPRLQEPPRCLLGARSMATCKRTGSRLRGGAATAVDTRGAAGWDETRNYAETDRELLLRPTRPEVSAASSGAAGRCSRYAGAGQKRCDRRTQVSSLVHPDSEIGLVPRFRRPYASSNLNAAGDGSVEIAQKRNQLAALLVSRAEAGARPVVSVPAGHLLPVRLSSDAGVDEHRCSSSTRHVSGRGRAREVADIRALRPGLLENAEDACVRDLRLRTVEVRLQRCDAWLFRDDVRLSVDAVWIRAGG